MLIYFEGVGGRGDGNGEGTVNENKVTWPRMQLLKNLPVYSGVVLPFKSCTLTLQLRLVMFLCMGLHAHLS